MRLGARTVSSGIWPCSELDRIVCRRLRLYQTYNFLRGVAHFPHAATMLDGTKTKCDEAGKTAKTFKGIGAEAIHRLVLGLGLLSVLPADCFPHFLGEVMRFKRSVIVAAAIGIDTLGLVTAAHAEGSFTSHFDNVPYNFETRRWTDNHNDSVATSMRLSSCLNSSVGGPTANPTFELRRNISLWPDESYGEKAMGDCRNVTVQRDWGEMTDVGQYFFRYRGVNGYQHTFSAGSVTVRW